jgi:pyruvate kinase
MSKKQAQIVATIGPASKDVVTLEKMIRAGMNVARLNFSWGTHEDHAHFISNIRDAANKAGVRVPIIQDLSGPRIQEAYGHEFSKAFAEKTHGGVAKSLLTEKDLRDLDFGAQHSIDYVAMSYVGTADDIRNLRKEMDARGYKKPIIAKIEREKALKNLAEIVKISDAIMVARGDLGNEVPLEAIPYIQLDIIRTAKKYKKPVITATQMMLTMKDNPQPTRAEVTDVAYAILDGSDAVMLSEESAQGKYPVETVLMMRKIITEAEAHEYKPHARHL